MASITLLRHGETAWSLSGQHTGRTDIPLTDNGRERAKKVAPLLAGHKFGLVLTSPLSRAKDTAELAGLKSDGTDDDLLEWDYGAYDGLTTAQIREQLNDPTWVIWGAKIPPGKTPGETTDEVGVRCARVIARCTPFLDKGEDCALVAHGHLLRILTATWVGLPSIDGQKFALEPGALSTLGFEHETHVLTAWNITPQS